MNRLMKIEQKADGSVFAKILTPSRVIGVTLLDVDFNETEVAALYDCVNVYNVEFEENELLSLQFKNEELQFLSVK